ncbi:MAG: magnesium/cobalt transporter CorA [Coriobacteriia bacterium]|nr:magnesium/cobalt transporter CorA [Coriobacteriia bacterium]
MTEVSVRWLQDGALRTGNLDDLGSIGDSAVWIDILDADQVTLEAVSAWSPLHPLAMEDCLHFPQRPKLDVYEDSTFLIWLMPELPNGAGIVSRELDVFLGREHLITVHSETLTAVDKVAAHAAEYLERGAEWTLHGILDLAVDGMFPLVDDLADTLEGLEDAMLLDARTESLEQLYGAKRALVQIHKVVGPERDAIRGLARLEAFVAPEAYMYFQDVGDHLARVADSVDTYREVASGTMDIYLSSVSNRMNLIMKQLTVIATIFMPLTLISGIYGMNFRYMPELEWRFGYFGVLGGMLLIMLWMLWFFKRRKWW